MSCVRLASAAELPAGGQGNPQLQARKLRAAGDPLSFKGA